MMNKSFSRIRDTRQQSQVRHDLYEIISMTIAAVIGNCDGWDEIEDFCQSKEKWLYVLSLSENQPTLHEYAETCFKDALEHPQWYPEMTSYETVDKEHGKIEKRTYYLSSDLSGLENAADWSGLSGFGMVRSQVTVGEVESYEIRYTINSLKSVEQFAHAWRKHWRIENGLHYCLDYPSMKTILASERIMRPKIWL